MSKLTESSDWYHALKRIMINPKTKDDKGLRLVMLSSLFTIAVALYDAEKRSSARQAAEDKLPAAHRDEHSNSEKPQAVPQP